MNNPQTKSIPLSDIQTTVAFLDPAGGKQQVKKTRAKSAIVVLGSDPINRLFVLYTWAERCETTKIYEKIYEVAERFKLDTFGIESSGQQSLFVDSVIQDALIKQKTIPILAVPMPTSITKTFRVRTIVQPVIKQGRLFINKIAHKELYNQIRDHPMNTIVDLIDALASAINLIPTQPLNHETQQEAQQLLDYLRNTGTPPDIIQRVSDKLNNPQSPQPLKGMDFHQYFNLNK